MKLKIGNFESVEDHLSLFTRVVNTIGGAILIDSDGVSYQREESYKMMPMIPISDSEPIEKLSEIAV